MNCTFFGHRDTPDEVAALIKQTLKLLVEEKGVTCFYVGEQGNFDRLVRCELQALRQEYPHIRCFVVLAYLPLHSKCGERTGFDTIYPAGLETVPPRYAIVKRNEWMLNKADVVVTYVKYTFGGAAQLQELARRKGKAVYNLAEM